jgi:hypothetical protein
VGGVGERSGTRARGVCERNSLLHMASAATTFPRGRLTTFIAARSFATGTGKKVSVDK